MNPALLIARKDIRSYFSSPMAYVILAFFLFLASWMFGNLLSYFLMRVGQFSQFNAGPKPTLSESVLRPFFGNMNFLLLLVAPFVTMRLLAEDRRDHTIELLMTAPVRPRDVVLGKFLAGLGMLMAMMGATLVFPLALLAVGSPDWGVVLSSYLGFGLVCAAYAAVGLFWSSRTDHQIVAALLTIGTLLFFWLISWASHRAGPVWSDVLNGLSLIGHYTSFSQGVIDTYDVVFYLTFAGFALFLTNLSLEAN